MMFAEEGIKARNEKKLEGNGKLFVMSKSGSDGNIFFFTSFVISGDHYKNLWHKQVERKNSVRSNGSVVEVTTNMVTESSWNSESRYRSEGKKELSSIITMRKFLWCRDSGAHFFPSATFSLSLLFPLCSSMVQFLPFSYYGISLKQSYFSRFSCFTDELVDVFWGRRIS